MLFNEEVENAINHQLVTFVLFRYEGKAVWGPLYPSTFKQVIESAPGDNNYWAENARNDQFNYVLKWYYSIFDATVKINGAVAQLCTLRWVSWRLWRDLLSNQLVLHVVLLTLLFIFKFTLCLISSQNLCYHTSRISPNPPEWTTNQKHKLSNQQWLQSPE